MGRMVLLDFQKKFRDLCRQHSPSPRRFYAYRTSAIVSLSPHYTLFPTPYPHSYPTLSQDISSTTVTLNIGKPTFPHIVHHDHDSRRQFIAVRDGILKSQLRNAELL
jgi:hypothetical protein